MECFFNKEQNQNILNDELIKFYIDLIKKKWIKDIYNHYLNILC